MTSDPIVPDINLVPIGTIMPYLSSWDITEGWAVLDGQTLLKSDYPEFWEAWNGFKEGVEVLGGKVNEDSVKLPEISSGEQAQKMALGMLTHTPFVDMILVVKVKPSKSEV